MSPGGLGKKNKQTNLVLQRDVDGKQNAIESNKGREVETDRHELVLASTHTQLGLSPAHQKHPQPKTSTVPPRTVGVNSLLDLKVVSTMLRAQLPWR